MILHRTCPICGSESLRGYSIDTQRKGPHISRVQCVNCNLVFANPMADQKELAEYYTNYYDKEHYEAFDYKTLMRNHFHRIKGLKDAEIKKEARFLNHLEAGMLFLDIGCCLGLCTRLFSQKHC